MGAVCKTLSLPQPALPDLEDPSKNVHHFEWSVLSFHHLLLRAEVEAAECLGAEALLPFCILAGHLETAELGLSVCSDFNTL